MGNWGKLRAGQEIGLSLGDDLDFIIEDMLNAVAPKTTAALRQNNRAIIAKVKRRWPIGRDRPNRSFHSIQKFTSTVIPEGEDLAAVIINTAPWARMIRRRNAGPVFDLSRKEPTVDRSSAKKLARSKLVWKSLLARVGEESADKLLDDLANAIGSK